MAINMSSNGVLFTTDRYLLVYHTNSGGHEALVALILPSSLAFDRFRDSDGLHDVKTLPSTGYRMAGSN